MKCYKGFDKDLKCRDFQYEIGKEYEEERAEICDTGFHACENPLDVFGYYAPADSRYCEVDLDANDQKSDDSKRVGKKISIKAEIGIAGIIKAGVEYIKDQVNWDDDKKVQHRKLLSGNQHRRPVSGNQHRIPVSGNRRRKRERCNGNWTQFQSKRVYWMLYCTC